MIDDDVRTTEDVRIPLSDSALRAGESARQLLWSDLRTLLVDTERGAA